MNFLDNLVLPQSSEHIHLLHFLQMLIFFLFIPFISIVFGAAVISLYYKVKGVNESNPAYVRFSKDVIETLTINKSIGVILGIVPPIAAIMIYAQLLHTSGAATVALITASFFFDAIGLILIYTYRYSFSIHELFETLKDYSSNEEIKHEIKVYRESSKNLSGKSIVYGVVFLFLAMWLFVAGVSMAGDTASWNASRGFFELFSWPVLSRLIHFVTGAFAIAGAAILFGFFYWEGGKHIADEEYKQFIKSNAIKITFFGALFQPLFLMFNIMALPSNSFSGWVFGAAAIALVLLFLAYHFLYAMIKEATFKYSGHVFYALLFTFLAVIVQDQLAMNNSTKVQAAILGARYDQYLAALRGPEEIELPSGQEIYETRCASCHRFDQKLVGPPYNETLPKYEGKFNDLVGFILNPVKVNPAYPPMPDPGLRPEEAKAVAQYEMIEHMKSVFNERSAQAGDNGEQIFNTICAACHSFEEDMVGPSLNSVVSKYVDKQQELIAFLADPQKISPSYPQMPNPELSESQLQAISTYVINEYKKRSEVASK